MQNSFTEPSIKAFLSFLEALRASNSIEKFDEEKIRKIVREEFSMLLANSGTQQGIKKAINQNESHFIPFLKWRGKSRTDRFYRVFTEAGFLQSDKTDFKKPLFIDTIAHSKKLIWLHSGIELIYTFNKLIYQYSAIPLSHSLYVQLSESFLIKKRNSKKTKSPNPFSLETFHSRIRKSKISYPDIDDALKSVFEQ